MKQWAIPPLDKALANRLKDELGLPALTAMLLSIRGITNREEISRFLSTEPDWSDPFLIKDMDKAVERIRQALERNEKICVYGDYDCDGVTSTAMLYSYLESVFADVMMYIPDRGEEGYGMNQKAVSYLKEQGVGMDTVITDHHRPPEILPRAVAIVNPHRLDDPYPFKDYCGAGLVLKLLTALSGDPDTILENYSDLAALGTVADVVSLRQENRSIVRTGLFYLENSDRIGLSRLIEKSGSKTIDSNTIAFRLAPRINAAGRLGSPYDAVRLFLTEDEETAEEKADLLDSLNAQRQGIESEIFQAIHSQLQEHPEQTLKRIIIVSSPGWNAGVVGIVSSRVTERYGKPSIIISEDGDVCKASGRSVEGFSLVDAVFACSKYLEKFGGHPMAVGFSIKKENIQAFSEAINAYADQIPYMPLPSIGIDICLKPEFLTLDMLQQIEQFEPFGSGNPKPLFGLKNMQLDKITPLGNGKHLKLSLSRGETHINAMKFFITPDEFPYREGEMLDIAVNLERNEYRGVQSLSFIIKDIRLSEFDQSAVMYEIQDYELYRRNGRKDNILSKCPVREDFAAVYKYFRANVRPIYSIDSLVFHLQKSGIGAFKLLMILDIFAELSLIRYERNIDMLHVTLPASSSKVDLDSSTIYQKLKGDIHHA